MQLMLILVEVAVITLVLSLGESVLCQSVPCHFRLHSTLSVVLEQHVHRVGIQQSRNLALPHFHQSSRAIVQTVPDDRSRRIPRLLDERRNERYLGTVERNVVLSKVPISRQR